MPTPDALRSSLDSHQVDRKAGRDREYVESVLRRIQAPQAATTSPGKQPAQEVHYGENVVIQPTDDTPTFSRVKPIKHTKKVVVEDVIFKEISAKKKAKKEKATKGKPDRDNAAPVIWEDVAEGEDPNRKPDPKSGYMKGNYALLRRQMDSDHAVYFFATEIPDDAEQSHIPTGYELRLTEETRLPYIARRGKAAHLNQTAQVRAKDRDEAIELVARKGIGGIHPEA